MDVFMIVRTTVLAGLVMVRPAAAEPESTDRRISLLYGRYSPERMIDILRLRDSNLDRANEIGALAYAQRIGRSGESLDWEVEGQVVQHSGVQNHPEVNGVLIARWTRFPWDAYLNTSAAFGWGLSYAFEVPELEPRSDREEEESARLLNYLLVEIDAKLPGTDRWSAVLRLHHRSGIFGLYGGVEGGSNYIAAGLHYHF